MMYISYTTLSTPLGCMLAAADEHAVYFLQFIHDDNQEKMLTHLTHKIPCILIKQTNPMLVQLEQELQLYFQGKLQSFTIPTIFLYGTNFEKQCWQALQTIPYGKTASYKEQAYLIKAYTSYRAVANANKKNPLVILYPCHRIIKTNGNICGYNGGIRKKEALLKLEST